MRGSRLVVSLLVFCAALPALAGQSLQLFGGYADTRDTDLSVELLYWVPPRSGSEPVNGDSSSFGIRYLLFAERMPSWSFGIDFSRFEASSDTVGIDVWPLTFEVIYTFRELPVRPYLGLGYSLTYVEVDISSASSLGVSASESSFGDGPAFLAGVTFPVAEKVSLFLEYRRDWTEIDFETESIPIFSPSVVTSRYDVELVTDRLLIGISYDF